ncbi:MAG TPA: NAD(P)/FAD-dependent oxidoreductase [Bacteroidia bacterium]|nr:NAD(P)/FAD-dependent oxidoreductase [Bacteroidia bacterium]
MNNTDIIIIGAGACGLMAAYQLSKAGKRVEVIDARAYTGGRVHTMHSGDFKIPVETGAEFIHGNKPITLGLLKEFGIKYHKVTGEMRQVSHDEFKKENNFMEDHQLLEKVLNKLNEDIPVEDFLNTFFKDAKYTHLKNSVRGFVEGYDAADISRASALSFKKEWLNEEDDQYRVEGGYSELMDALVEQCEKKGCRFRLSSVITKIEWENENVAAVSETHKRYRASKAIITIPLGLLQEASKRKGTISFVPEIPAKRKAAQQLGFGGVVKFILQFSEAFWKTEPSGKLAGRSLENLGFLFSRAAIPTWWTQLPNESPVLTGWIAGPGSNKYLAADQDTLLKEALGSLAFIFHIKETELKKMLTASQVINWSADPFSRGGYGYEVVNGKSYKELLCSPEENTLYFAGEALATNDSAGTVEAALASGIETAEKMLKEE